MGELKKNSSKPKIDEGYVKYTSNWLVKDNVLPCQIEKLNFWRTKMYKQKWIGHYPDLNIGFGNISAKVPNKDANLFLISGTQTGNIRMLSCKQYCWIQDYNLLRNTLTCQGPIQASSEAMSHAAVYELSNSIQAVIHIHDLNLWQNLMNKLPTTKSNIPYGTPEMAFEIKRLYRESNLAETRVLVMAGHKEGIISFGKSLESAAKVLYKAAKM